MRRKDMDPESQAFNKMLEGLPTSVPPSKALVVTETVPLRKIGKGERFLIPGCDLVFTRLEEDYLPNDLFPATAVVEETGEEVVLSLDTEVIPKTR